MNNNRLTEIEQTHLLAVISILKMRYLQNMSNKDIVQFMREQYIHLCIDDPLGKKMNLKNDPILRKVAVNLPKLIKLSNEIELDFSQHLIELGL